MFKVPVRCETWAKSWHRHAECDLLRCWHPQTYWSALIKDTTQRDRGHTRVTHYKPVGSYCTPLCKHPFQYLECTSVNTHVHAYTYMYMCIHPTAYSYKGWTTSSHSTHTCTHYCLSVPSGAKHIQSTPAVPPAKPHTQKPISFNHFTTNIIYTFKS